MNKLYPIFLKVNTFKILIVGGGTVAHEKLSFLLKSSPDADVKLVSKEFNQEVLELIEQFSLEYKIKEFSLEDLKNITVVIGATNHRESNIQIYNAAKQKNILVNIADNPPLCDFYMGSIVTKGNLKIAFSTNGKSPTLAKRLRQFFEEIIPENIDELLDNLNNYRKTLAGDFQYKVNELNQLTQSFIKPEKI